MVDIEGNILRSRAARLLAAPPNGNGKPAKGHPKAAQKADAGRWRTLNEFVDLIGPHLTLAEKAVWVVLFRHARNGVCETTARMLATAAGVSVSTAQRALERLHRAGLIWPIWKSKDRSKASKYGIHPRPNVCLSNVTGKPGTVPIIGTVDIPNRTD